MVPVKMYIKLIIISALSLKVYNEQNFKLQQVLILSRHNVRTPLSKDLAEFTPKPWPTWKEKSGYLTAKGALLEGFMGEFFSSWLQKEGLISKDCPNEDSFFVYANTAQRTMASAKAFLSKGFPSCNITIHSSKENIDPIFNPVIHNNSDIFKKEAMVQMQMLLRSLHLDGSYEDLEQILNYKSSNNCLKKRKCDLVTDKNSVFVNVGFKPGVDGPLKVSKSVIDSFIMENYEGFPLDVVAWGQLKTAEQWNPILELTRGYHDIIFNTTLIAKDIAKPLLKYMADIFLNEKSTTALLMGHDANLYTVLKSMGFKPYNLKNQFEKIPAGGKLVFQKWMEMKTGVYFMKIDYVYQQTDKMRDGKSLSLDNPPEFTTLYLEGCKTNDKGYCLWNDFVLLLKSLIEN